MTKIKVDFRKALSSPTPEEERRARRFRALPRSRQLDALFHPEVLDYESEKELDELYEKNGWGGD